MGLSGWLPFQALIDAYDDIGILPQLIKAFLGLADGPELIASTGQQSANLPSPLVTLIFLGYAADDEDVPIRLVH